VEKLHFVHPLKDIQQYKTLLEQQGKQIGLHYKKILDTHRLQLQKHTSQLESLSPLSVLSRGYSITYRLPDNKVVRRATEVEPGQCIRIRLSEGSLECVVQKREKELI
jgi:exodeoxyribonuclease VII large subunit